MINREKRYCGKGKELIFCRGSIFVGRGMWDVGRGSSVSCLLAWVLIGHTKRKSIYQQIMLGSFQQSQLRLEVEADQKVIGDSLLRPRQLQQWLSPLRLSSGMPEQLENGLTFTSSIGPVTIGHQVQVATPNCLRFLLSGGIDGFHEWYWGDGWVQSRLEGVSPLPLNLGQTFGLLRLRQFLVGARGA